MRRYRGQNTPSFFLPLLTMFVQKAQFFCNSCSDNGEYTGCICSVTRHPLLFEQGRSNFRSSKAIPRILCEEVLVPLCPRLVYHLNEFFQASGSSHKDNSFWKGTKKTPARLSRNSCYSIKNMDRVLMGPEELVIVNKFCLL